MLLRRQSGTRSACVRQATPRLIASGDTFVSCAQQNKAPGTALPGLLAVEMDGAAVAQVCFELGVPFKVIRNILESAALYFFKAGWTVFGARKGKNC